MASNGVRDKLVFHGEFLQNLNVANFFIGLKDGCESDKVRKVVFEKTRVVVSVESEGRRGVREAAIAFPARVALIPRSMSAVKPSSRGGCSFRFAYESSGGHTEPVHADPIFLPRCETCANRLLSPNFASGLLLSAFSRSSYFCHGHAHDMDTPEALIPLTVSSYGEYFEFHHSALDVGRKLKVVNEGERVLCARCHQHLGFQDRKSFLLYKHRLRGWDGSGLRSVLQQLTSAKRFHITPKEVEGGSCVEVWVMDRKLLLLRPDGVGEEVCKVLFKVGGASEPEVKVEAGLALQLLEALERSKGTLPLSWQTHNGYGVGFLA